MECCMWMLREGGYGQNQLKMSLCHQIPVNLCGRQWDWKAAAWLYGTCTKDGSQRDLDTPASSVISYKRLPDSYHNLPDFPFS